MNIPVIHPQIPRMGNRVTQAFGRFILWACRWHVEGAMCDRPKFLIALAPHTSWWDFVTNFGVLLAIRIRASWFIADKYTFWPMGNLLRKTGAIPVDRSTRGQMVEHMVSHFKENQGFMLAIFPEGTRKKVVKWKTGFWHIAKLSNVPIQLVAVDHQKRATVFGPIIYPSDSVDEDIEKMRAWFSPAMARYPEKFDG